MKLLALLIFLVIVWKLIQRANCVRTGCIEYTFYDTNTMNIKLNNTKAIVNIIQPIFKYYGGSYDAFTIDFNSTDNIIIYIKYGKSNLTHAISSKQYHTKMPFMNHDVQFVLELEGGANNTMVKIECKYKYSQLVTASIIMCLIVMGGMSLCIITLLSAHCYKYIANKYHKKKNKHSNYNPV
jgi:hypothetical protein